MILIKDLLKDLKTTLKDVDVNEKTPIVFKIDKKKTFITIYYKYNGYIVINIPESYLGDEYEQELNKIINN